MFINQFDEHDLKNDILGVMKNAALKSAASTALTTFDFILNGFIGSFHLYIRKIIEKSSNTFKHLIWLGLMPLYLNVFPVNFLVNKIK